MLEKFGVLEKNQRTEHVVHRPRNVDIDIIAIIKAKRLRWLGEVHQREEGTRLKEALMGTPTGK